MSVQNFTTRRGPLVVLGVFTLIAIIILFGVLKTGLNYNNDRIQGEYSGSLTIHDTPTIAIDIHFDGEGGISGVFIIDNETLSFSDNTYVCIQNSVQFSVMIPDTEYMFIFNGTIDEMNLFINGQGRFHSSYESYEDGTFYLAKEIA